MSDSRASQFARCRAVRCRRASWFARAHGLARVLAVRDARGVAVKALLYRWSEFFDAEPVRGPALLALVIACLISVGYALEASKHATNTKQRVWAVAPAAVLTAVAVLVLGWLIGLARETFLLRQLFHIVEGRWGEPELEWLHLLAPVIVVALPTLTFAFGRVLNSTALRYSALIVFASALAVVAPTLVSWHFCINVPLILRDITELNEALEMLGFGVVGCSIAIVAVAVRATKLRFPRTAALLVFVLGASAFAFTRSHAHDRRHPVAMRSNPVAFSEFPRAPKWLNDCSETTRGIPIVSFEGTNVYLDQLAVVDPVELRERLHRHKRNWSILQPGRPFAGAVNVRAHAAHSLRNMQPWLEAMYEEHFRSLTFVFDDSARLDLHTLGLVSVRRVCGVEFSLVREYEAEERTVGDAVLDRTKGGTSVVPVGRVLTPTEIQEWIDESIEPFINGELSEFLIEPAHASLRD